MRITQNMLNTGALTTYQRNLREIGAAQQKVSTGLRFQRASEDPVAAVGTMQASGSLRALEQYRRNIDASRTRADAEERVFEQLSDVLSRAKELALSQGTGTADADTRRTVQAEIEQLIGFTVQLANTQVVGSHIFGGNSADQPPVSWEDQSAGPPEVSLDPDNPGAHRAEIAAGQYITTTNHAHEVFTEGGIFASLWDLSEALGANDVEAIQNSVNDLDSSFNHIQGLIGDLGARSSQLEVTSANLDALETNLLTFKSNLQEVDFEKAVTELVSRQTTFQAAMLAASRVMGMTLTDYLR